MNFSNLMLKKILFLFIIFILFPISLSAHSGGTDLSGGHHCWTDCEKFDLKYGEYHFHDKDKNPIYTWDHNDEIYDRQLTERLSGRILLQVEEKGEAWYIHPDKYLRYYMQNGDIAYQMMRFFSLGITNEDLNKIPSVANTTEMNESTSICNQNSITNRLKGRILLQVEEKGEAWYVDPVKCRSIYMKDGAAAYEIMRFLGLGITNIDLNKIPVGIFE